MNRQVLRSLWDLINRSETALKRRAANQHDIMETPPQPTTNPTENSPSGMDTPEEENGTKRRAAAASRPERMAALVGRAPVRAETVVGGISCAARSAARGEGAPWTPVGEDMAVPHRAGWELVPNSIIGWIWRAAIAALASEHGHIRFTDEDRIYSVRPDGRLRPTSTPRDPQEPDGRTEATGSGTERSNQDPSREGDMDLSAHPSLMEVWRLKDQSRPEPVRVRVLSTESPTAEGEDG